MGERLYINTEVLVTSRKCLHAFRRISDSSVCACKGRLHFAPLPGAGRRSREFDIYSQERCRMNHGEKKKKNVNTRKRATRTANFVGGQSQAFTSFRDCKERLFYVHKSFEASPYSMSRQPVLKSQSLSSYV